MSKCISLAFSYDENMRPVLANCTFCGEQMPTAGPAITHPADMIWWVFRRYLQHCDTKHLGEYTSDIVDDMRVGQPV